MDFGINVKRLRKTELNMTREEFGKKLGVSASVINNIELGRLARPEQKEPLYRLICKTYNVRYEWLMNGEEPMFATAEQSFLDKLTTELGLSATARKIVECYLLLDDAQKDAVDHLIETISKTISGGGNV